MLQGLEIDSQAHFHHYILYSYCTCDAIILHTTPSDRLLDALAVSD